MQSTKYTPASYQNTGVRRYNGNPFIEAQPKYPLTKMELLTYTAFYPERPTAALRKSGEMIRVAELRDLSELRLPMAEYHTAAIVLTTAIREPYVPHNPMSVLDVQRRHEIASAANEEELSTAMQLAESRAVGHMIVAPTGHGKSTFGTGFLSGYHQVIQHSEYRGQPLRCIQFTYLVLRCPHDGTLKALCLEFFYAIDLRLGTTYLKQALGLRHIAPMVLLMKKVATAVSLGLLVIDELQNLRVATGAGAELMLALFSDILEKVGVSLLILATPAVHQVLDPNLRNIRKLTTTGDTVPTRLTRSDKRWKAYTDEYWGYCYTRQRGRLTGAIRDAWYDASGGNYGFAAAAYYLAQLDEIGGRERVDELSFARVARNQMAFLQPAISALVSGRPRDLLRFDDLILPKEYDDLRSLITNQSPLSSGLADDEFEEIAGEDTQAKKKRAGGAKPAMKKQSPAAKRSHPAHYPRQKMQLA